MNAVATPPTSEELLKSKKPIEPSQSVDTLFQKALSLHQSGQWDEAEDLYKKILNLEPQHFDATHLTGLLAYQKKDFNRGVEWMSKAIALEPRNAGPYSNLGILYKDWEQYDLALQFQSKAIELDPHFHQALYNRANLYKTLGKKDLALKDYTRSIELHPTYLDALVNRGSIQLENKNFDAALRDFDQAILAHPEAANAHFSRGVLFTKIQRFELALPNYRKALKLDPTIDYLLGEKIYSQLFSCDWSDLNEHIALLSQLLGDHQKVSPPLIVSAVIDSPGLQKIAAEIWTEESCPPATTLEPLDISWASDPSEHKKIRIAYISSDFQSHPVSILLARLFELHDPSRFEIIAFDSTQLRQQNDPLRDRIVKSFDQFFEIRELSDEKAAQLIRDQHIDVAFDLGGHTLNARLGILAHRVAPVQISYVGYLGTLGAPYIDYILADETLIPEKTQAEYKEKIIYLPCYQVNDPLRKVASKVFSRQALGLPETGFVYCCFNNNYKITPEVFHSWMRILDRVPGSSLLLLEDNAKAKENLMKTAASLGVNAQRLVFGQRMEASEYLARYKSADLFLDTHPYNAGTTASDALWVGLPVITRIGKSFASRMAASALMGVGLEELITQTPEDYEDLAIKLGTNAAFYQSIQDKLKRQKDQAPLFNTEKFTRHLETALEQVVHHARAGLSPQTLRPNPSC